jgi:hypothetical protein
MRTFTFNCECTINDKETIFEMEVYERYADRAAKIIIEILKAQFDTVKIQYVS